MTELTERHLDIMIHTYAADSKNPGYRNNYCGAKDDKDLNQLVSIGLMVGPVSRKMLPPTDAYFFLTQDGIEAALAEVAARKKATPKLTRSQERYQRYLEYGDGFDSFRDFLRWDSEPDRSWNKGPNQCP